MDGNVGHEGDVLISDAASVGKFDVVAVDELRAHQACPDTWVTGDEAREIGDTEGSIGRIFEVNCGILVGDGVGEIDVAVEGFQEFSGLLASGLRGVKQIEFNSDPVGLIAVASCDSFLDECRIIEVVGIEIGDPAGVRAVEAGVEGGRITTVRLVDDVNQVRVALLIFAKNIEAVVGGAVIDSDDVVAVLGFLVYDAVEGRTKPLTSVVDGHGDGYVDSGGRSFAGHGSSVSHNGLPPNCKMLLSRL